MVKRIRIPKTNILYSLIKGYLSDKNFGLGSSVYSIVRLKLYNSEDIKELNSLEVNKLRDKIVEEKLINQEDLEYELGSTVLGSNLFDLVSYTTEDLNEFVKEVQKYITKIDYKYIFDEIYYHEDFDRDGNFYVNLEITAIILER